MIVLGEGLDKELLQALSGLQALFDAPTLDLTL